MNKHVHRLVFDHRRGMRVPAHEHARSARKAAGGQTRAVALVGMLALSVPVDSAMAQSRADGAVAGVAVSRAQGAASVTPAAARPVSSLVRDALNAATSAGRNLPTFTAGGNWALNTGSYQDPTYSTDGKIMTLVQNGTTIVLNWDSFDIGKGYEMRFVQPTGGRALNRVANLTPSVIDGVLSANGEIMLENTAGVIFGSNARVNTQSFVATALKISSTAFESGIRAFRKGEASFGGDDADVNGFVSVEQGAEIRSLPGGDVILVAPRVVNQGLIETPQGQAIMAAGKTVYLYAPLDAAQRGLLVSIDNFDETALAAAPDLGSVENVRVNDDARSGTVRADKGTINLVGAAIRQKGTLTATTAVKGENGAIFLTAMKDTVVEQASNVFGGNTVLYPSDQVRIAQNTGTVELAAGSVTEVLPSVDGLVLTQAQIDAGKIGVSPDEIMRVRDKPVEPAALSSTATDAEKAAYKLAKAAYDADLKVYEALLQQSSDVFYRSRIDIIGKEITLRSGSVVQAPAGEVNILATSNWATSSLNNSQFAQTQDDSRLVMESGAKVDVSGLNDLLLPASRNQLQGRLFSIELADSPLQRDGVIYRAELLADARRKITIGDATGLYNDFRYSAAEYATAGGIVHMQAQGGMLLAQGALIDFSGGQVTYDAGTLVSSLLLNDGALTRIEDASKDTLYSALLSDPSRVTVEELLRLGLANAGITAPSILESQKVGMSAGVAVLSAPSMAIGATLDGHVTMSEVQRLSTNVAERDLAFNPGASLSQMTDASRMVNRAALLTDDPDDNSADEYQPNLYASLKPTAGLLVLGQHGQLDSTTQVPQSTVLSSINVTSTAPTLPTVASSWTTESWQQALSQMGQGLTVSADLISNAGLAGLSLQATTVTVGSAQTGDTPSIRLASGGSFEADTVAGVQINGRITSAGGAITLKAREAGADVVLGSHAVLDVAGTVRDERLSVGPANEGVARQGGTVTVEAERSVIVAAGSEINVSGAAWRSSSGSYVQGKAGSISLAINKLYLDKTQAPQGSLTLDGTLSGYDFSSGGSLKLSGLPSVVIGGTRDGAFSIGTNLFAERGFGALTVESIGHVDVVANAQVRPQLVNMVATAARLGGVSALPYELTVLETGKRQGSKLTLTAKAEPGTSSNATYGLPGGANLTIGQGAVLDMGIGGAISLSAGGSIEMAGTLQALAGNVSLKLLGTRGATAGDSSVDTEPDGYLLGQRIHLAADSLIDVSGTVKSYSADGDLFASLGLPSREVGEVLAGGTVTLGGSDGTATRGQLIMDEKATIRLKGASGELDRGTLPGKTLLSAAGGTLNIMSTDGFQLLGTIEAAAPNASVAGGTINIALSQEGLVDRTASGTPTYPEGEAAGQRTIRITGTQDAAKALSADGLKFGEGVVSAELLNGAGFDRIQLRADESIQLNAGANLVAAKGRSRLQSVVLNAAVIDVADGGDHLVQAHQVAIGPQVKRGDSRPVALPNVVAASERPASALAGSGSLQVQAGLIEVAGDTAVLGTDHVVLNATLARSTDTALTRTDGEIRFLGQAGASNAANTALTAQLTFAGQLDLIAGQVYATTLSHVSIKGVSYTDGDNQTHASKLTISAPQAGSTSQTPLSALASLSLAADEISLDGVVRQPFGTIDVKATKLSLTDRANLSVSGDGVQVPVGSTVNQTKWVYGTRGTVDSSGNAVTLDPTADGSTVVDLSQLPINKQITLNGDTLTLSSQSAVDVKAGGDLLAWEFKQGVGGTTDTYLRQGVYAILPTYSYDFAPYDTEIRATSQKLGSAPQVGDQVTITTDNGVLRAGTYTLLDARYGILPGAVLVSATSLNVTASLPVAVQNDDGSVIVSGYKTRTGTTQNGGGDQRLALTLEPESTFRKKSEIILTSGNAYQAQQSLRSGNTLFRPGDGGRISLVSSTAFDWAAQFNLQGNGDLKAGQFDLAMPDMVVQADDTQKVPTGAKSVSLAQLNALGAESVLLGGVRTNNADGSITVTRMADNVTFQADVDAQGTPVDSPRNLLQTTGELMAVAKNTVTVENGLTLASTGTDTGDTRRYVVQGDGATLQVGQLAKTDISVTGSTDADQGNLVIGKDGAAGKVVLRGNSVQLDATNTLSMAQSTDLSTRSLSLGAKRMAVGADASAQLATSTLAISGRLLTAANNADRLKLRSYTSIDLYGSTQLGSSQMSQLTLDAPQLLGMGKATDTVLLTAREVTLANSSGRTAPASIDTGASSLLVQARPVLQDGHTGGLTVGASLAEGQTAGAQAGQRLAFTTSTLDSSGDIVFDGRGQTTAQGDLILSAARVTATSDADQQVNAAGALTIQSPDGSKTLGESLGAGGKLSLAAATIAQNGLIDIDAGRLNLLGRGVAGQADTITFAKDSVTRVDGRLRKVSDSYAVASGGGQITAEAQTGNLVVNGLLSAAAPVMPEGYSGDNPYAGSISLKAAGAGTTTQQANSAVVIGTNADINLEAASGKGGSLSVDARRLTLDEAGRVAASTDAKLAQTGLDKLLQISSNDVNESAHRAVDIRVRNEDLALNTTVKAAMVALTSDSGNVTLGSQAKIDATVPQGGVVQLQAKQNLVVNTGAQILAQSTRDGANGGDILLASTDGTVQLGKATIKADSVGDKADGRIVIRAAQTRDKNGNYTGAVNAELLSNAGDPANAQLTLQAGQIEVEGVRVYKNDTAAETSLVAGTSSGTAWGLSTLTTDAATFTASTNKDKILSALGLTGRTEAHVKAGIELQTKGNLTIGTGTDINLSTVRAGGEPLTLTVRAAGDINVNSTFSDGFTLSGTTLSTAAGDATSMRFVAGADLSSAKLSATQADTSTGHFTLAGGKFIRTTAGSIDVNASGDVRLMAPTLATTSAIYVAGRTSALDSNERFTTTTAATTAYTNARFTERGGRLTIAAGGNVGSYASVTKVDGVTTLTPQQLSQMTGNYFYHGGNPNAALASQRVPVAWWTGLNAFRQGFGSFGGGNISVTAGNDISNVAVVAPTNARTVQVVNDQGQVVETRLKELNGGNIEVLAGRNIDGGVYFLGHGQGRIAGGGAINRGADGVADGTTPDTSVVYEPGAMLGLMNGHWDVSAVQDLNLSYVFNPTALPFRANGSASNDAIKPGTVTGAASGLNASTSAVYFTYAADAGVSLSSLHGDVNWEANGQSLNRMHQTSASEAFTMAGGTSSAAYLAAVAPPVVNITSLEGDTRINSAGRAVQNAEGATTYTTGSDLSFYVMPSAQSDVNIYAGRDLLLQGAFQLIDGSQIAVGLPSLSKPAVMVAAQGNTTASYNLVGLNALLSTNSKTSIPTQLTDAIATPINDLSQATNDHVVHAYAARDIVFDTQTDDGLSVQPFLRSNRPMELVAGRDLINPSLMGQNFTTDDLTLVSAGRDIIGGINTSSQIVVNGPGALRVEAGRDILLNQSLGVVAAANQINTALPAESVKITLSAGNDRTVNIDQVVGRYGSDPALRDAMNRALADSGLPIPGGAGSWSDVGFETALGVFQSLTKDHQSEAVSRYLTAAFVALYLPDQAGKDEAYYRSDAFLRLKQEAMWQQIVSLGSQAVGIAVSSDATEEAKRTAQRKALFAQAADVADLAGLGASFERSGNIDLSKAKVHNYGVGGGSTPGQVDGSQGGIDVIAAGQVTAGLPSAANAPAGFINFEGGSFRSITGGDFLAGDQKVIVLGRGNLTIYSMDGSIDSGKGSNTAGSKPQPIRAFDEATGKVIVTAQAPTTGSGFQAVENLDDVDTVIGLYAPNGEIRALDAYIKGSKVELVAPKVVGADNIANATGAPAAPPPNVTLSLTPKVADTAAGVAQAADPGNTRERDKPSSLLTVELLGFGEEASAAGTKPATAPVPGESARDTLDDATKREQEREQERKKARKGKDA